MIRIKCSTFCIVSKNSQRTRVKSNAKITVKGIQPEGEIWISSLTQPQPYFFSFDIRCIYCNSRIYLSQSQERRRSKGFIICDKENNLCWINGSEIPRRAAFIIKRECQDKSFRHCKCHERLNRAKSNCNPVLWKGYHR